jgi:hypothetical protein
MAENRVILHDKDGLPVIVAEGSTLQITGTLKNHTGAPIAASQLDTLTLTLYARDTPNQEILNSVSGEDIFNTGRGNLEATSGLFTLILTPADAVILDDTLDLEWHRALIQGTFETSKQFNMEIDFPVRNLDKVS